MRKPAQLLRDAWSLFMSNPKLFVGIYLVPTILTAVYTGFIALVDAPEVTPELAAVTIPFTLALTIALIVISIISGVALIKAVASPQDTSIVSAYKFGWENLWSYLWVSILVGLAVLGGFILLIIPGIIFAVWFTFSYFALVLEGKKGKAALRTSREYVRGRWWAVFGRFVVLLLLVVVLTSIARVILAAFLPFSEDVVELALTVLNVVLVPYSVAYTYLLYMDIRKLPESVPQPTVATAPADASTEPSTNQ